MVSMHLPYKLANVAAMFATLHIAKMGLSSTVEHRLSDFTEAHGMGCYRRSYISKNLEGVSYHISVCLFCRYLQTN
jgi:hypothetical protein